MTIERLEKIESEVKDPNWQLQPVASGWMWELITECKRLRTELNAIAGKAKEALDG